MGRVVGAERLGGTRIVEQPERRRARRPFGTDQWRIVLEGARVGCGEDGLRGGDDAELAEPRQVRNGRYLDVLDAMTLVGMLSLPWSVT